MSLSQITQHAGEWLRGAGPHSEVVISSRVRLARNLAGFPFVNRANTRQRCEVLGRCCDQVMSGRLGEGVLWIDLPESTSLDRQLLVERHLISRQHASAKEDLPRAVGDRRERNVRLDGQRRRPPAHPGAPQRHAADRSVRPDQPHRRHPGRTPGLRLFTPVRVPDRLPDQRGHGHPL